MRDGRPDWDVVRSVLEARRLIGRQVARLAAARATDETEPRLRDAVARLATGEDPVALQVAALEFWERVVDAADSLAFRLIFNSLRNAYEPAMTAMAGVLVAEVGRTDLYERLAGAIVAHDEDGAERAAGELLDLGTSALTTAIDHAEHADARSLA